MYDLKEIQADFESVCDEEAPSLVKASEVDEEEGIKNEKAMECHAPSFKSVTGDDTSNKPAFMYF